jgi:putative MATE family efflux protein
MERIPSFREILKIAVPIMIGGVSESISAVVDTAFMGKLGTLAIDGMGMTNIFLLMIFMIGWSFSRSVQILVSQNFGAKNFQNIGEVITNAIYILVPISVLLFFILYFFNIHLLGVIIQNPEIKSIASEICQIRSWGLPILMTTMIFSSFFTGIGRTKILIYSQGIAAISNIIFNYILVFGKFGFPAMGYRGSAWATVISEIISLGIVLFYLIPHKNIVTDYFLFYQRKIKYNLIKEISRLAMPMFVLHAFSLGSWIFFFSLIEKMGEKELAISLVIKQIFIAISIPGFCLATTSNTIVGQLVGARKIDYIIPTIFKIAKVSYSILLPLALLTFIFRTEVVSLFTTDVFVLNHITNPLLALLTAFLFIPFSNVMYNSISALGNTKVPLILETFVLISYLLYLYIVMKVMEPTLIWAWLSEFQYWLCLLLFCLVYFWKFDWKKRVVYLDER